MLFSLGQILNVSLNLQIAIYLEDLSSLLYFNGVEEHEYPLNCTKIVPQMVGYIFLYSHLSFTVAYGLKKIGLLILLNCEAASLTVFTTMFPKEQQTSDNLIVKDNCFIIEIFGRFSFSWYP